MEIKNEIITEDDLRTFMENLQKAVGNKEKINEVLENHELVIVYLTRIGVNPEWLERMFAVECMKNGMVNMLLKKDALITEEGIFTNKNRFEVRNGILYINRYLSGNFIKGIREVGNGEDLEYFDENMYEKVLRFVINPYGVLKECECYFDNKLYRKIRLDGKRRMRDEVYQIAKNGKMTLEEITEYDVFAKDLVDIIQNLRRYPRFKEWFEYAEMSFEGLKEEYDNKFNEIEKKGVFNEGNVKVLEEAIAWQEREATIKGVAYNLEKRGLLKKLIEEIDLEIMIDDDLSDTRKREIKRNIVRLRNVGVETLVPQDAVAFKSKEELIKYAEEDVDKKIKEGAYRVNDITEEERAALISLTSLQLIQNQKKAIDFLSFNPSKKRLFREQEECLKYMYRAYMGLSKEDREKMKLEEKIDFEIVDE